MAQKEINGVSIYYEDSHPGGSAEAICFFNGSLSSATSWNPMLVLFKKQGIRTVIHDYRGQMLSPCQDDSITYKQHASDAALLFKSLGLTHVHVVGTSYGTMAAQRFVLDYPDMVKSMTLIEAFSEMDANTEGWVLRFVDWLQAAIDDESAREKLYLNMLPLFFHPDFAAKSKDSFLQKAKAFRDIPGDFFKGMVKIYENQLNNTPITSELYQIKVPTLVVWGEEDVLTPWPLTQIILKNIPHADVIKLPNTGHVAMVERAKLLEAILFGFVTQNSHD